MDAVGLRKLRQDASALVRRVEQGEVIEVTVAGRPAARLVPVPDEPRRWNVWEDVVEVFSTPTDTEWDRDRDLLDHSLVNVWEEQG